MSFGGLAGNFVCPICGTWQGPANGDIGRHELIWCDECLERSGCKDCQEEAMDEQSVRTSDEVFVPPHDAEFEGEVAPDFDDLDD